MHVVLYEPDIPGNTGNVGRSCVATGTVLLLVGKSKPRGTLREDGVEGRTAQAR